MPPVTKTRLNFMLLSMCMHHLHFLQLCEELEIELAANIEEHQAHRQWLDPLWAGFCGDWRLDYGARMKTCNNIWRNLKIDNW